MRVLIAVHQFPPFGAGGTEQLARWTARGLRAQGHTVTVVSAVPKRHAQAPRSPGASDADGLDVRFLEPSSRAGTLSERIAREYDDGEAGARFAREIDSARPDVIHFFHLAGLTASAAAAARQRGVPYLFTASDFWYECPTVQLLLDDETLCAGPRDDRMNCAIHLAAIRWPLVRAPGVSSMLGAGVASAARPLLRTLQARSRVLREAITGAAAVLAPNDHMHARLRAFGIDAARLRLVPYPVPEQGAAPSSWPRNARMRVVFIGTLAPSKGAHVLLEAVRLAPDLDVDVHVYGEASDVDYEARLRKLASDDRRIRFCGTFEPDAFAQVVDASDLLVVPSVWYENSPLVLLQALARRCPVLVSEVPGLAPHLRGAQDGWTFERANARDLASKLRDIERDAVARADIRSTRYPVRTMTAYMADIDCAYAACASAGERR